MRGRLKLCLRRENLYDERSTQAYRFSHVLETLGMANFEQKSRLKSVKCNTFTFFSHLWIWTMSLSKQYFWLRWVIDGDVILIKLWFQDWISSQVLSLWKLHVSQTYSYMYGSNTTKRACEFRSFLILYSIMSAGGRNSKSKVSADVNLSNHL